MSYTPPRGTFTSVPLDYATREPAVKSRRIDVRLGLILLVALVIRLGWVLHLPVDAQSIERLPDQREYLELGRNLLENRELHFFDPRFNDTVYAYRVPGYPILIALCRGNVQAVRCVQAILDVSSVLGVFMLARLFMGNGAALLAAGIVGIDPFLIYFSGLILSETFFIALMVWGMYFLVHPRPKAIYRIVGTILLAVSLLVRPSAIGLPLFVAVTAAFVNRQNRTAEEARWLPPVGFFTCLICFCTLLPWAWRNQRVLGSWIWTTTNSGITLYDGFNPDATGASDQTFTVTMPQLRDMDEIARSEYLNRLAWQYIREHPIGTIELAAVKVARTWSPIPLSAEFGSDWKLVAVAMAFSVPLDVLIILGIGFGDLPRSLKVFLTVPALYFTLIHAVSVGSLRYRIPAEVPMAVVAGSAVQGWNRLRQSRRQTTHPAAGIVES